jgi:hypothetical protein
VKIGLFWILLFWTLPCVIVVLFPFGVISKGTSELLFLTNFIFYFAYIVAYKFFSTINISRRITSTYDLNKERLLFTVFQINILVINLYVLIKTNFVLGIVDMNVRLEYYEVTGNFWTVLVSCYTLAYVIFGRMLARKVHTKKGVFLMVLNSVIYVSYGMKSSILQIIISLLIGYFGIVSSLNKNKALGLKSKVSAKVYLLAVTFIISGFWLINSLRAGFGLTLKDFGMLIYLYIAPPFTNFSNIAQGSYYYPLPLGGLLGGVYKLLIPGYTEPLLELGLDSLENETWNVWSYLSTFFVSGGFFEVYFGTAVLGFLLAVSIHSFKKSPSLLNSVLYVEVLSTFIFLHNQYHFSSFAPVLSILIAFTLRLSIIRIKQ